MERANINYTVCYRKIKYARLEFRSGELQLILPFGLNPEEIINKHCNWIKKKLKFIDDCLKDSTKKQLVARSETDFKELINHTASKVAAELGVKIDKIGLRKMKTKWASCNVRNANITINRLMQHLPQELVEYIVFHEAAHLIERNHNQRFWQLIRAKYPNHNYFEQQLFAYWFLVQGKTPIGAHSF